MKNNTLIGTLAIIVVVIGIVGAYYFGAHRALAPTTSTSTSMATMPGMASSTTTTSQPGSSSYYTDVSAWQTSIENPAGFSIAYPLDFSVDENNKTTPTTDWRVNSTDPGVNVITITVPKSFEPQTNFVDATLTVGYSQNTQAVANCFKPAGGPVTSTSTANINGINFSVFSSSDAGAGNIYKTTSYRTMHAGSCYAVEYTVHSAQLANFPASYGLTQYSDPVIDSVLNRIVGTFRFL